MINVGITASNHCFELRFLGGISIDKTDGVWEKCAPKSPGAAAVDESRWSGCLILLVNLYLSFIFAIVYMNIDGITH